MKTHVNLNLVVLIFCSIFLLVSCSKDTTSNIEQKNLNQTFSNEVQEHPLLVQFVKNGLFIYQQTESTGRFNELKNYIDNGITNEDIPKVATIMGFENEASFNQFFS